MEEYEKINRILKEACNLKESEITNKTYEVENLSMRSLAWILIEIGKVKKEDLENNIYIATIPGGIAKKNYAVVVLELSENELKLAAYADEGLINQHTSNGAINEFEKHLSKYIKNYNT
jgi:hypothetical protein